VRRSRGPRSHTLRQQNVMDTVSSDRQLQGSIEYPTLDWDVVVQMQRRARKLRAEAFTRALCAPWVWLKFRIERARAPLDFAPIGTCP